MSLQAFAERGLAARSYPLRGFPLSVPLPEAPVLRATPGNAAVTLTWQEVEYAASYALYWGTAPGITTGSTVIDPATSPYSHTGRTNGQPYYYRASATNGAGESPLSNEVSATPAAPITARPMDLIV